jgi:hypothetical protein
LFSRLYLRQPSSALSASIRLKLTLINVVAPPSGMNAVLGTVCTSSTIPFPDKNSYESTSRPFGSTKGCEFALIWRCAADLDVQENSRDGRRPFHQPRDVCASDVLKLDSNQSLFRKPRD